MPRSRSKRTANRVKIGVATRRAAARRRVTRRAYHPRRTARGVRWHLEESSMRKTSIRLAVVLAILAWAPLAAAQTADEVIEKSIAALGGRAAHAKIKSRSSSGTIVLTTPGGDITGTVEALNAAANKSRALIKADLSQFGAGQLEIDQRFDGHNGYMLNSLQGNSEMTASQLNSQRNGGFPHPFLSYKERGMSVQLKGKEKVGDRDAFVLVFDPTEGSEVRFYVDAGNYLPIRMVAMVDVPQLGKEIEQSTDFEDYKELDGIKIPYRVKAASQIQSFTLTFTKAEHNVPVDEKLFVKP